MKDEHEWKGVSESLNPNEENIFLALTLKSRNWYQTWRNQSRHIFAFQWLSLKKTNFISICIDDKISNVQLLSTD